MVYGPDIHALVFLADPKCQLMISLLRFNDVTKQNNLARQVHVQWLLRWMIPFTSNFCAKYAGTSLALLILAGEICLLSEQLHQKVDGWNFKTLCLEINLLSLVWEYDSIFDMYTCTWKYILSAFQTFLNSLVVNFDLLSLYVLLAVTKKYHPGWFEWEGIKAESCDTHLKIAMAMKTFALELPNPHPAIISPSPHPLLPPLVLYQYLSPASQAPPTHLQMQIITANDSSILPLMIQPRPLIPRHMWPDREMSLRSYKTGPTGILAPPNSRLMPAPCARPADIYISHIHICLFHRGEIWCLANHLYKHQHGGLISWGKRSCTLAHGSIICNHSHSTGTDTV